MAKKPIEDIELLVQSTLQWVMSRKRYGWRKPSAGRGALCFSSINHPQHYENENKKGRKSNKKYQNTMWILILISAIFWAIICYTLAQKKDKDKGIAFVMGLLFGLFAVIYYAVCSEGSFRCPFCQGQIRSGVKVCKHCGKEIEWK